MNRQEVINHYHKNPQVSLLIIGAGVNGIGTFRDLALQNVDVLLVDRKDFCSGASAASSHMIHGGIRYLQHGDLFRVRESSYERNVLLRGESGVGKERVALLLHSFSDRAREPFVPLNCAALPETLLESELFGIEEGVATGVQRRHGKIELANGGTLFLDEVADLSLALQAKFLRVVQEREFERLGGRERIPVDIHLVTATNRDLEAMVEKGEFRRDLYYRLRVVVVEVPTLRDRRADVPLLARHFLELYGERFGRPGLSLSREALAALMAHPFPGNVRELENAIQAAIALAPEETITVDDLRLKVESRQDPSSGGLISLGDVERRHIENVLRAVDGNRQEAARILGIDRTNLYRKLQRFASYDAESIN